MKSAKVISAGRVSIPSTGRDALSIITDLPYLVGGEVGVATGIYVDPSCPEPETGDPVSWKGGTAWVNGWTGRRYDYEFNPATPLH